MKESQITVKGRGYKLKKFPEQKKESTPSTEQERGQIVNHLANELQDEVHSILRQKESQEELWNEVEHYIDWPYQEMNVEELMKHFNITRKP